MYCSDDLLLYLFCIIVLSQNYAVKCCDVRLPYGSSDPMINLLGEMYMTVTNLLQAANVR